MFSVVSEPQLHPSDVYSISLIFGGHDAYLTALWPCIILFALSAALLGLFTSLALFASLLGGKVSVSPQNSVLLVVILLMYASAVLHCTTLFLNVAGYYNVARAYAAQLLCQSTKGDTCLGLCPLTFLPAPSCTMYSFGIPGAVHGLTVCVPTGILTINVMLGDAVVWWRVWVIWPRSLIVRITCVVLLAATLAMGIIDTLDSCSTAAFSVLSVFNLADVYSGSFYQSDFFGLSASGLSLATNMVATILIGCKAWWHSMIMAGIPSLRRSSRVEKFLVFLVESGTVYCVIWVSILIYQVALLGSEVVSAPEEKVFNMFDYFIKGCLIPLIGINPTIIITLVALNKSHFYGTSFGGGPVSDISFRNPMAIASTSIERPSLPMVASWTHTSTPSRIDDGYAAGVECQVDEPLSPDSCRSSRRAR
ncbi:hypothetical protein V8D89_009797 [Ganoderma adspersum]